MTRPQSLPAQPAEDPEPRSVDAVVVGSGPNGLAAAITLARAGRSVAVFEAAETIGGGTRSAELTLPGFVHDVCSAIHPFGRTSPFFASLDLEQHGLRWVDPPAAMAHPLDDGPAVLVERDVNATADQLGADARAYRHLVGPLVRRWEPLIPDVLSPFHLPIQPLRALRLAWFGRYAIQSATSIARRFHESPARALFAGIAAHSMLRLTEPISAAGALALLAAAHADGWPLARGGTGRIADAMVSELRSLGGTLHTGRHIRAMDELPSHEVALFDTAPRALLEAAGDRLSGRYRGELERYRPGPGIFKLDMALDGPIPWRDQAVLRAGTVHLGGTLEEIAAAEAEVAGGRHPDRPFVLLAQQSLFDPGRAPRGGHTVWAYCHVPNGSTTSMREPILRQIERFAPAFRDRILATAVMTPAQLESYNPNDIGGDISGGRMDLGQLFTRPAWRLDPYSTPDPRLYLCSASTPPGAGVHGMCGFHAARSALRKVD